MSGQYDTIFKAMRATSLRIVSQALGLQPNEWEELSAELPITLQKKPDAVAIVHKGRPDAFVLHLEIQSSNDPNIV